MSNSNHHKHGSTNTTAVHTKQKPFGTIIASLPSTSTGRPSSSAAAVAAMAAANPTTDYQRLDLPMNRASNIIDNNLSYDSDDSYHSHRSYTSYNYISTSIRDRLYYNTNHNHHHNTNSTSRSAPFVTTGNPSGAELSPSLSSSSPRQPDASQTSLLTEEDQQRIQYLALRKFHIPGHTFTQDYVYW